MSPRDLVYVGHMLDMAKKAVGKVNGLSHGSVRALCEVGGRPSAQRSFEKS
jgi:hypothetical protein